MFGAIFGFDRTLTLIDSCRERIRSRKLQYSNLSAKTFVEKVKTAFAGFNFAPAVA